MLIPSKKKYRLSGAWPKNQQSRPRTNPSSGTKPAVDISKLPGQPIKVREIKHKPNGGYTDKMVTIGRHKHGMTD